MQPDEYEKLGSYALVGLPDELYKTRCVSQLVHCEVMQGVSLSNSGHTKAVLLLSLLFIHVSLQASPLPPLKPQIWLIGHFSLAASDPVVCVYAPNYSFPASPIPSMNLRPGVHLLSQKK